MAAMMREMNKGGKLLWIAPSGGRDRPDSSGQTLLSAFPVMFACQAICWYASRCCKGVPAAGRGLPLIFGLDRPEGDETASRRNTT